MLRDPILWLLTAVGALLIFLSLGQRCLWQDEAETALLGRNLMTFSKLTAFDGVNLVSQELGAELDEQQVWRWSPIVQFALAGISISLFGATAFAARLPFAVAGILTIPLVYILTMIAFRSRLAARLSIAFMVTSVPYLLHVRQARWHAVAYLCIAGVLIGALKKNVWLIAAAGTLLFYTNYFVAIVALIALAVAAPVLREPRRTWIGIAITAGLSLPGVIYYHVLSRGEGGGGDFGGQLAYYAVALFTFLLPLPIAAMLLFARSRATAFFALFIVVYIGVMSFAPWRMFRYETLLIPAACVLMGVASSWLVERNRIAGAIVIALLIATNVVHDLPFGFAHANGSERADGGRSPFVAFLGEITHDVHDSECEVIDYLRAHAKRGETILTSYGDLPIAFATPLHVTGGLAGQELPSKPDWILARTFVVSDDPRKDMRVVNFMKSAIDLSQYAEAFSTPDVMLSNAPDPRFHRFRTDESASKLKLIRLK